MNIMISGSMAFAKDMVRVKEALEKTGHTVFVPHDLDVHVHNPDFIDDLAGNFNHVVQTNIIRKCFDLVAKSDAILVLNLIRKGIDGYIGTSTLMEIGLAYYLRKKIFLYNDIPHWDTVRWAHEIKSMQPIIINGDLDKII